jgi:membrane protease YdiL (CAAX protease family)
MLSQRSIAVIVIILLWLAYSTMQTLSVMKYVSELTVSISGLIFGLIGVRVLLSVGNSRQECFLILKPISKVGFAVLFAIFIFALSAILPFGVWQGWSWMPALVYAPLSGISQELFFRSALLPAMRSTFNRKPLLALFVHSLLFGLWHIGPLFIGAPVIIVISIMFVPFLSGIGWGWQVEKDGTVVFAMIQHSLIWVVGMQFAYTG